MADNTNLGEALDWDDEVSDEGGFTLLPAGDYPFEVAKIDKEYFEGSSKMAPCPRAAITLNILTASGWVPLVDRLLLNTKTAWRVARFFEGLGFAKEPNAEGKMVMHPHWGEAVGRQGWCRIKVREYEAKGEKRQANDVDAYLKPEEWPEQPAAPAQTSMPVPPQPPAQPAASQHPGWSM